MWDLSIAWPKKWEHENLFLSQSRSVAQMKKVASRAKVLLVYALLMLTYAMSPWELCNSAHFPGMRLYCLNRKLWCTTAHIVEGAQRNALLDHSENNVELVHKIQIFRLWKKASVEGDLGVLLRCQQHLFTFSRHWLRSIRLRVVLEQHVVHAPVSIYHQCLTR